MMAPVIRVDAEVWSWLKTHARPLEDTPNSVLRRLAGLDSNARHPEKSGPAVRTGKRIIRMPRRDRTNYGRDLNEKWNVGGSHALYHKDGTYYNHLRYFPGALFDRTGYLVFKTEDAYIRSPYLQRRKQLHVPAGIASVPGYVRAK